MKETLLDDKDFAILDELMKNARQSVFQIAKKTNIPPTTIHNRVRKMKANGVISGYTVRVDREKTGQNICALVFVSLDNNSLEASSRKGGLARQLLSVESVR